MNLKIETQILRELRRAWDDSLADNPTKRHEEGGYIVVGREGRQEIIRWPNGSTSRIRPPDIGADGCYNGLRVIAAFHTHPNPPVDEAGDEWDQEPSVSDLRWHARKGLPGLVISAAMVYDVFSDGTFAVVGTFKGVLSA